MANMDDKDKCNGSYRDDSMDNDCGDEVDETIMVATMIKADSISALVFDFNLYVQDINEERNTWLGYIFGTEHDTTM